MDKLEELDFLLSRTVCELISEQIDSLTSLANSPVLHSLLLKIQHSAFQAENKNVSWLWACNKLSNFASQQSLTLELDVEELEKNDLASLVTVVAQVLALISIFNVQVWEKLLHSIDHDSSACLTALIDPLAKEFRQNTPTGAASAMRRLMDKLEAEEAKNAQAEDKIHQLEELVEKLRGDLTDANTTIKRKTSEVEEQVRIKDITVRQLEEVFASNRPSDFEQQRKLVAQLNYEKETLNERLIKMESLMVEKSGEAEKLKVLLSVSEAKRREAESLQDTCDKLLKNNDELKLEREIRESKLHLLDVGEKAILKYQEKIKEESQKSFDMRLQVNDLEAKVKLYEKKMQFADENFKILRSQNLQSEAGPGVSADILEEENAQLKEQVRKLQMELNRLKLTSLDKDGTINNQEMQLSKLKTLSLENNMLIAKNKRLELASRVGTFTCFDGPAVEFQFQPRTSLAASRSALDDELKLKSKQELKRVSLLPEKSKYNQTCDLIYSALMQYHQHMLFGNLRYLTPAADERKRDILKQFTLNNIIKNNLA